MAKFKPPYELIREGYIRFQTDEETGLRIYNYTEKTQYEKQWNEWTLQSRGMIVDKDDNIVARPFDKFFNYEEYEGPLPDGEPEVFHKMDGSLGIVYWYGGKWRVATRGSFKSDQAIVADGLLTEHEKLDKGFTHLYEIIYPENRIVVDYGQTSCLVYLYSRNIETGEYKYVDNGSYVSARKEPFTSFEALKAENNQNSEGYVLVWPNGFRLKIKFDEYKRLHYILTSTSTKSIWRALREGRGLKDILERVPDEFYSWVKLTSKDLYDKFNYIFHDSQKILDRILDETVLPMIDSENVDKKYVEDVNRLFDKEVSKSIRFLNKEMQAFVFARYRKMPREHFIDEIWKSIEPAHSLPFKIES